MTERFAYGRAEDREFAQAQKGLHTEQLAGRTQQVFFSAAEEENFLYPAGVQRRFQQARPSSMRPRSTPVRSTASIRELMKQGYGTIVVQESRAPSTRSA